MSADSSPVWKNELYPPMPSRLSIRNVLKTDGNSFLWNAQKMMWHTIPEVIQFNTQPPSFREFLLTSNPNPSYSNLDCFILLYSLLSSEKLGRKWFPQQIDGIQVELRAPFSIPFRQLKALLQGVSTLDGQEHHLQSFKKWPVPRPHTSSMSWWSFHVKITLLPAYQCLKLFAELALLINFGFLCNKIFASLQYVP